LNIPCEMGLVADTRRGKAYESGEIKENVSRRLGRSGKKKEKKAYENSEIKENVSWKLGRVGRKKRKRHTKTVKSRKMLAGG